MTQNNVMPEIENQILKIDQQLLILHDAPQKKEYRYYDFGTGLKYLIDIIQKYGLHDNPYYNRKIQEYIAVYKDLFGGTDLKNNMTSKLQIDGVVYVSHILTPRASKVSELLYGCKVDYSAFASDECYDPNIFTSKYDADKYHDKVAYKKAYVKAYQYLTEKCWNVGHKFNIGGNGRYIIMTFEQYISNLKSQRAIKEVVVSAVNLQEPDMDLFQSFFVADKKGWLDSLLIDIPANLKSGKGGYTIVAMAKVIYDSGKLHTRMKPKQFAPWLRTFCQAWGIAEVPTSKAGNNGVKSEIARIEKAFYYLNVIIPK